MLVPIVQGGLGFFTLVLDISSNVTEYNILTAATAAGYNAATDVRPIVVNVASGVTVSGSSTHAMRTGALNANSDLTINISGSVDGYTGANGGLVAQAGSAGGDALFFETATGGTGTYIVNVLSGSQPSQRWRRRWRRVVASAGGHAPTTEKNCTGSDPVWLVRVHGRLLGRFWP